MMAGREYQGAGGMRIHLDEPLNPEMAKQVAAGHLAPVPDDEPDGEGAFEDFTTQGGDGPKAVARPNANSKVDEWRAYAVGLGMPEDEAADATKAGLQDWVSVAEGGAGD